MEVLVLPVCLLAQVAFEGALRGARFKPLCLFVDSKCRGLLIEETWENPMEEAQAIKRLKQGDIGGLETLVWQYQVRAMHAAYLITGDRMLAEDVVQGAFLQAFERIHQFDAERPFGPWFLRSVANRALKAVTRCRSTLALDTDAGETLLYLLNEAAIDPENEVQRSEIHEAVMQALDHLPPSQRAAVVARYYLGLSEAEMVDKLDCAPGTVKWRLYAARRKLRAWLKPLAERK